MLDSDLLWKEMNKKKKEFKKKQDSEYPTKGDEKQNKQEYTK